MASVPVEVKRWSTRIGAVAVAGWMTYRIVQHHLLKKTPAPAAASSSSSSSSSSGVSFAPTPPSPARQRLFGARSHARSLSIASPKGSGTYAYGTAGFRGHADTLPSVCLRMGMLAALRSRALAREGVCPAIGVMVTASHNPEEDNGLKIVDDTGEMLKEEWEAFSSEVANAPDSEVDGVLKRIGDEQKVDWELHPTVVIGCDTRRSSPELLRAVAQGIESMDGTAINIGVVTTPQLHWAVRRANGEGLVPAPAPGTRPSLETKAVEKYYDAMADHFTWFFGHRKRTGAIPELKLSSLIVDCANGVGAKAMEVISRKLSSAAGGSRGVVLPIDLRNTGVEGSKGRLNHLVGAEHIQKKKTLPENIDGKVEKGKRIAALDGDADRLVYSYIDDEDRLRLLDGDKIAALYSMFIIEELRRAGLTEIKVGVVQTAYANGAATRYLEQTLKLSVACTGTGIKFLHKQAGVFEIGLYFEANGHGTVLFQPRARELIELRARGHEGKSESGHGVTSEQILGAERLLAMSKLLSQCTGDAIADVLAVEAILATRGMTIQQWDQLYEDSPSKMISAKVKDRTVIRTVSKTDERRCVSPPGLQDAIDALVRGDGDGLGRRAFVRPSGTEDIVRIYAEAPTQEAADALAEGIKAAVTRICV